MTPSRASRRLAIAVLVLTGCSPAATPSPTASPTPVPTASPTPVPTASPTQVPAGLSELALAYLVPLTGYEYVGLPPEVELQVSVLFQSPIIKPYLKGYVVRSVTANSESAAVAMVLEFEPSYLALPNAMKDFVNGVAGSGSGGTVEQSQLAGREVYGVTGGDVAYLSWQDGPLVVVLFGSDSSKMVTVAEALITAHI